MGKNSVGVYIASKYVDIAELGGSSHAPRLLNFRRQQITLISSQATEESKQKNKIPNHESIAFAIKEGLGELGIRPDFIYTVLPSNYALIRNFSMPLLPKSEQLQAIMFEARKYIPFKLETIINDFKVSQPSKTRKSLSVFFIAATKDHINSYVEIFKTAGPNVRGIDIISFALVRMLLLDRKISIRENVAILYIDSDKESASINIIERGMPFLSRDFKISVEDKESLFERVVSEMRVSLDYYRRLGGCEVTKVIICGEKPYTGLDAFISDELKIISEQIERFVGISGAERTEPSAIIAMGTALGGLGKSVYSVNLSPSVIIMRKKKVRDIILVELIAALFIIIITYLVSNLIVRNSMAEVNRVKDRGSGLPDNTAVLTSEVLAKLKEKKLEDLKFLQAIVNNRIFLAEKLDRIAKDMPSTGVWINNITMEEVAPVSGSLYLPTPSYDISIKGGSFSPDTTKQTEYITKFFMALREDPIFMKSLGVIDLGSIDKVKVSGYWLNSFNIYSKYIRVKN